MEVYNKDVCVGRLNDGVYVTTRKPQHYFYKFRGFGISDHIVKYLEEHGCLHVKIIFYENLGVDNFSKKIYHCPLSFFIHSNIQYIDVSNGSSDLQKIVTIQKMIDYAYSLHNNYKEERSIKDESKQS